MEEKHLETSIAQYAVILKDKKMLILWPSNKKGLPFWTLPGGRINETDRDYEAALSREVKEEIGHDINLIEPICVGLYGAPDDIRPRYSVFFLCELKNKGDIKLSHEHREHEWLGYQELISVLQQRPDRAGPGFTLLKSLKEKKLL